MNMQRHHQEHSFSVLDVHIGNGSRNMINRAVIDEKWIVEKCINMVYTERWTEQNGNEILEGVDGMDGMRMDS